MADYAPDHAAPQHGPRPLPLFLDLLRSETAADPARRAAALGGLKAYQAAARPPRPAPVAEIAHVGRACLRDYGGEGRSVVFVPSLINPPFILDLAENNSLLRWLATQGVRPLLLDWGNPPPPSRGGRLAPGAREAVPKLDRDTAAAGGDGSIAGHIEHLLLPLLDTLAEPPALVGYCLGGTMALAAAALRTVRSLTLIATPWRFAGFPPQARADIAALWAGARASCEALGLVPIEVLQSGFWRLDPARTVAKFEAFAAMDPASDAARAFIALEDWANAGAPLTYAAGREAFEDFFAHDLPGRGEWRVGGSNVDPARLACPVLDIVSLRDRIVPAASATGVPNRLELGAGHVGMIVGGRAKQQLWEPLAEWLVG